jgi:hypothetical protein
MAKKRMWYHQLRRLAAGYMLENVSIGGAGAGETFSNIYPAAD